MLKGAGLLMTHNCQAGDKGHVGLADVVSPQSTFISFEYNAAIIIVKSTLAVMTQRLIDD